MVALIANASLEDQAVAIAGRRLNLKFTSSRLNGTPVSYLFRSLGMVIAISLSAAVVQGSLRSALEAKLPIDLGGEDIAEVRSTSSVALTPC